MREDDMGAINSADTAFVLVSAALVAVMTPGLAFFYGGLVRRKNVLAIMMQSFVAMGVVTVIWILGGFSLAFGSDIGGLIGNPKDFFALRNVGIVPNASYGPTIPFLVFFAFQEMFAIITPALITGAFADRVNFKAYLAFLVGWSLLVYIPFAHWVWGGGFLAQWGLVDFAGGIVVHLSAGIAALSSVIFVGHRHLKIGENTAPHNIGFVALGTGLLWFGWFGFNAGSALGANGISATAFVNTDVAGSVAMITWLVVSWLCDGKPSMTGALTGAVAGLATVTPAAGYIRPWAAAVVGVLAGLICYSGVRFRARRGIDDALDVFACHGVGGALGIVLTGVFASAAVNGISGLVEGNVKQFGVQCAGMAITCIYSFTVTFILLKVVNLFTPVRVTEDVEDKGLDTALHGETAYIFGG
jgi:ammonium transporter, Amt family